MLPGLLSIFFAVLSDKYNIAYQAANIYSEPQVDILHYVLKKKNSISQVIECNVCKDLALYFVDDKTKFFLYFQK